MALMPPLSSLMAWVIAYRRNCQYLEWILRIKRLSQNSRRQEELASSAGLSISGSAGSVLSLSLFQQNQLSPISLDYRGSCGCALPFILLITAGSILSSQLITLSSLFSSFLSSSSSLTASSSYFKRPRSSFRRELLAWLAYSISELLPRQPNYSIFCFRAASDLIVFIWFCSGSQKWSTTSVTLSLYPTISAFTLLAPMQSSSLMKLCFEVYSQHIFQLAWIMKFRICLICFTSSNASFLMNLFLSWVSRLICGSKNPVADLWFDRAIGISFYSRGVPVKAREERPTWLKKFYLVA